MSDEKPPIDFGQLEQMFADLFGQASVQKRGSDLRQSLRISSVEARDGATREIRIARGVSCQPCGGSGARDGISRVCPGCRGTGAEQKAAGAFLIQTVCPTCRGARKIAEAPCAACDHGLIRREEALRVTVPPGIQSGQILRLRAKGDERAGTEPGDLYLAIEISDEGLLQPRGDDVVYEVTVGARHVLFGGALTVPTLDGETAIRVPRGVRDGETLTLPGRGQTREASPYRGADKKRGDQIVVFRVPKRAAQAGRRIAVAVALSSALAGALWLAL
jgi:molecular chaperone DnaJ